MENSKIEWTDHTFNPWIDVNMYRRGVITVTPKRKINFLGGMAVRGVRMRRVTEQLTARGKIPSNGMRTLVPLKRSMAIDQECSAHRWPMFLTIKFRKGGAGSYLHLSDSVAV